LLGGKYKWCNLQSSAWPFENGSSSDTKWSSKVENYVKCESRGGLVMWPSTRHRDRGFQIAMRDKKPHPSKLENESSIAFYLKLKTSLLVQKYRYETRVEDDA